ncbi:class I SAM-dependent methyltransferase [Maridesulfovibrio sp. FT414]|uniref:class I SAM-dependent methyltransferase n=1 Tax=Maridesulfovibrio sp. FT414 TaxID=2979469 RepID=UPI003D808906
MDNKLYTDFAHEYAEKIQSNVYNALYERPSLLALLPCLKGKKVLDLGCGSGEYSGYFLEQGADVTALDISVEMLEIMRERFGDRLKCYEHDFSLGLPHEEDDSFDVVVSPLAIHYVEDLRRLFSEIGRVLKRGGQFVFSTHHPMQDFSSSVSGNYFETELLTQEWGVIGRPVQVSFYRRSLEQLIAPIVETGLVVTGLSEGIPHKDIERIDPAVYERLSTRPLFLFVRCAKIGTER